VFFFV